MFVRFSTVGGEKGSADTERDPRGFAVKFYTEEGTHSASGLYIRYVCSFRSPLGRLHVDLLCYRQLRSRRQQYPRCKTAALLALPNVQQETQLSLVFFIRDPQLFPDLIHSQKRNPQSNLKDKDAFWDFFSHVPETVHQVLILFSDRGTPYSYRHMHGFGSHTFKWVHALLLPPRVSLFSLFF